MERRWGAAAADAACVLVFIGLGRRTHDEAGSLTGLFVTAAPFLLAAALAWVVMMLLRWPPGSLCAGMLVASTTWSLGMLLRAAAFGGGTAAAFVAVAGLTLAATMMGWRSAVLAARRHAARGDRVIR